MKLGISKFEYIDSRSLRDYSGCQPGQSINLSSFIKTGASFVALPFTMETANFSEEWRGVTSEASFSASVRARREKCRRILQQLKGRKCVFRITRTDGVVMIIGSPEYVPTFSYAETVSGLSSSEFAISVQNTSVHGVLFDSGE